MLSLLFHAFSGVMSILNRGLAWLDFAVHYTSGYALYYILGGIKPQTHTRPSRLSGGRLYTPSVVITGASEGIGLAIALKLAGSGYNVFATVKDESEIHKVRSAATDLADRRTVTGDLHVTVMDVLSQDSIADCAKHIASVLIDEPDKPLVGVVNNAGFCMISPMELTSDEDVRRMFDLDFFAYISVIRAFLPMIKQNKGRFINIGSFGGYANVPMWVPYCAVKAAIENMTRCWRFELMHFGVGMTTIRPGFTRTWGIGPKIRSAWENYYDNIDRGAVGVDSLGNTIMTDKPRDAAQKKNYEPILDKWHTFCVAGAEGVAQPSEAVAETVHDALTDRFLMPYYSVGYDALLGQMARDLLPESIWEYSVAKTWGCL